VPAAVQIVVGGIVAICSPVSQTISSTTLDTNLKMMSMVGTHLHQVDATMIICTSET
jgi:hypothetical protein